jgi:hypothetical protein
MGQNKIVFYKTKQNNKIVGKKACAKELLYVIIVPTRKQIEQKQ